MQVRLFGALRYVAGRGSCTVEVQPTDTVRDLLDRLARICPDLAAKMLDPDGSLQEGIGFLVNGRDIRHLDGVDTPVREKDDVAVFPAAGGG